MLKLTNFVFIDKFLINSTYFNKKTLNFLFLKFYFLLIQKIPFSKSYFFFNFFFYKKLWITFNSFSKNFYYKTSFKKFYKKYFFIDKRYLICYNYNIKSDCIFFLKNNKNFIIKIYFFLFKFLNFKLISFFYFIIKNRYFFNFSFNFFFMNYFNNLNEIKNVYFLNNPFNESIKFDVFIVKSIRNHSNTSLLKFNKVI